MIVCTRVHFFLQPREGGTEFQKLSAVGEAYTKPSQSTQAENVFWRRRTGTNASITTNPYSAIWKRVYN